MKLENRAKQKKRGKRGPPLLVLLLISTTILLAGCIGQEEPFTTTTVTTPSTTSDTTTPEVTTSISTPEEKEPPNKILFIGDHFSYWNKGLDYHMKRLTGSANPPLDIETDIITKMSRDVIPLMVGGLKELWDTSNAREEIDQGAYDVVVLQEDLDMSLNDVDTFHEAVRKFAAKIKETGAETVLLMCPPWDVEASQDLEHYECKNLTTEEIAQAYYDIATELSIDVAPVALAWQRAMEERPDLDLYDIRRICPSKYGTYLTVNVIYTTVFGKSPIGLTYLGEQPTAVAKLLTEEEAAFLQRIAWETVQEYPAQQ